MTFKSYKKDPDAKLDYMFDWTAWLLTVSDSIASAAFTGSAGLTIVSSSNTANTATAFVSGGVAGGTETLTCRIVTTGGRIDDRTINLKITTR